MKNQANTCDAALIERCLNDSLDDAERTAFEKHLEECESCQQRLEQHAALADDWHAVRVFLSSDSERALPDDDSSGESSKTAFIQGVLAVLGPTDDPRMLGGLADTKSPALSAAAAWAWC